MHRLEIQFFAFVLANNVALFANC